MIDEDPKRLIRSSYLFKSPLADVKVVNAIVSTAPSPEHQYTWLEEIMPVRCAVHLPMLKTAWSTYNLAVFQASIKPCGAVLHFMTGQNRTLGM